MFIQIDMINFLYCLLFIYLFLSTFSDDVEGKGLHFHMHDALNIRPGNIKGHYQLLFLLASNMLTLVSVCQNLLLKGNI